MIAARFYYTSLDFDSMHALYHAIAFCIEHVKIILHVIMYVFINVFYATNPWDILKI